LGEAAARSNKGLAHNIANMFFIFLTLYPILVMYVPMDTQHTPIRNETYSFVLVILRLLYDWFPPVRLIALIEGLGARTPVSHAYKITGIIRASACQWRRNEESPVLGQLLKARHIAPMRGDFSPT
jgi:hypothetical protein